MAELNYKMRIQETIMHAIISGIIDHFYHKLAYRRRMRENKVRMGGMRVGPTCNLYYGTYWSDLLHTGYSLIPLLTYLPCFPPAISGQEYDSQKGNQKKVD